MLCRLAAYCLTVSTLAGLFVCGLLLLFRQEWGSPLISHVPSLGGLLQRMPQLSCHDLGDFAGKYTALAPRAGMQDGR